MINKAELPGLMTLRLGEDDNSQPDQLLQIDHQFLLPEISKEEGEKKVKNIIIN